MVKNLQYVKTLQICYLRHAEHHAKNRTFLSGLDHDTLFFEWPVIMPPPPWALFALAFDNTRTRSSHHGHCPLSVTRAPSVHDSLGKCSRITRSHCGPEQPRKQTVVLGHSLVHSLIRLHRSFVCLFRATCFARAICCAHSFAHSFARSWDSEW